VAHGSGWVLACLLLSGGGWRIAHAAQAIQSTRTNVEAHFAAAQQAQENKDYVTAEREYLAVLAVRADFAEVHMNLGLVYQLQNDVSKAMAEFRRALRLKPALAGANFFLGVDYCKSGEGARAIRYLKVAARQDPEQPDIWSWLATAQEMSGDFLAEVATLREGLGRHPRNVDMLYLFGHTYERLGREEATRLQKLAPSSARAEQLLAESYATSNAWSMAVMRFQNALAVSPGTPGLHVEMGEVLLRAGRITHALTEFDEELRLDPGSVRAFVRRGEAKLVLGDIEGALLDWTRAVDTDKLQAERILGIVEPGFSDAGLEQLPEALREKVADLAPQLQVRNTPAAHLATAFLAAQAGNPAVTAREAPLSATDSLSDVLQPCSEEGLGSSLNEGRLETVRRCAGRVLTSKSSAAFRIRIAASLFETGDYETSLEVLSQLAVPDQHSAEASYWRGRCYEKLATAAYWKLSKESPDSYRVHQLLGDLAVANGDDRKAEEEYRTALAAKPSLPNLHYSLGHLFWKDLKVREAREEFQAELKLDPRHPGALNELGDTYLLEHQPEAALPYLTRALAKDPDNLDIHRDLGTAYSELHNYERAAAEFRIAIASDHDGSVHYKLARTYQALGQKYRAAREFEVSTTLNRESHNNLEKQTERLNAIEKSTQDP
jgi:tetratricopeptide (TPR) repeat protein